MIAFFCVVRVTQPLFLFIVTKQKKQKQKQKKI